MHTALQHGMHATSLPVYLRWTVLQDVKNMLFTAYILSPLSPNAYHLHAMSYHARCLTREGHCTTELHDQWVSAYTADTYKEKGFGARAILCPASRICPWRQRAYHCATGEHIHHGDVNTRALHACAIWVGSHHRGHPCRFVLCAHCDLSSLCCIFLLCQESLLIAC